MTPVSTSAERLRDVVGIETNSTLSSAVRVKETRNKFAAGINANRAENEPETKSSIEDILRRNDYLPSLRARVEEGNADS